MRVKNIIIFNKEMLKEVLIKDLIKEEISYVLVGDELHFEDKIYRIYDSNLDKEKIANLNKNIPTVTIKKANTSLTNFEEPLAFDDRINNESSFKLKPEVIKKDVLKRVKIKQYIRKNQKVMQKNFNVRH